MSWRCAVVSALVKIATRKGKMSKMYAGIRSAQIAGGDAVAKSIEKDGKHKTMKRSQKGREFMVPTMILIFI